MRDFLAFNAPFALLLLAALKRPHWFETNRETRRGGGRPGLGANPRLKE